MPTAAYCWTVRWEPSARRPDRPAYGLYYQWGRRIRSAGYGPRNLGDCFCAGGGKIPSSIRPSPIRMRGSRRAGRPFQHWNTPRRRSFLSNKGATGFTTCWPSPRRFVEYREKPARSVPVGYKGAGPRYVGRFCGRSGPLCGRNLGMGWGEVRRDLHFRRSGDWYPTSGYRNRDKGNLAGLATTRTGITGPTIVRKHDLLFLYFEKKAQYGQTAPAAVFFEIRCGVSYNVRCCGG